MKRKSVTVPNVSFNKYNYAIHCFYCTFRDNKLGGQFKGKYLPLIKMQPGTYSNCYSSLFNAFDWLGFVFTLFVPLYINNYGGGIKTNHTFCPFLFSVLYQQIVRL